MNDIGRITTLCQFYKALKIKIFTIFTGGVIRSRMDACVRNRTLDDEWAVRFSIRLLDRQTLMCNQLEHPLQHFGFDFPYLITDHFSAEFPNVVRNFKTYNPFGKFGKSRSHVCPGRSSVEVANLPAISNTSSWISSVKNTSDWSFKYPSDGLGEC